MARLQDHFVRSGSGENHSHFVYVSLFASEVSAMRFFVEMFMSITIPVPFIPLLSPVERGWREVILSLNGGDFLEVID